MGDTFTVVIPTRNRPAAVAALTSRLAHLAEPPDQIVVVDDGTEPTVVDLAETTPGPGSDRSSIVVVRGAGDGPASARNVGARAATSEWLVFLDDDDEPDDDWMQAFRRLAATPTPARGRALGHLSVAFRVRRDGAVKEMGLADLGPAFAGVRANVLAGTFAIRRTHFDEIGGFLDGLRHMEFTELALRLFERFGAYGIGVAVDPASRLTIVARPIAERASQDPAVLVETGLRLLGPTEHLWRRDPAQFADQLATFGVAAVRAGRPELGRRWLVQAFRVRPTGCRHAARALASLSPTLAHRVWQR